MDIYNINKKLAQEKLNSDKPIKWIAIYNNGKLEIRAGYVLYHKDLRKKDEPLPIGGGILKIESQSDATWKLSLGGKSDDFGACDLLSFKNEDIDLYPLIDFLCWTLYFDEYVKPFKSLRGANGQPLDLQKYMDEHVYMYASDTVKAKFRVSKVLLSDVVDMFEKNLKFSDESSAYVTVTANVNEISMFQFAKNYSNDVVVLEPKSLIEKLKEDAKQTLKIYDDLK